MSLYKTKNKKRNLFEMPSLEDTAHQIFFIIPSRPLSKTRSLENFRLEKVVEICMEKKNIPNTNALSLSLKTLI